jgi:hypothetical protein
MNLRTGLAVGALALAAIAVPTSASALSTSSATSTTCRDFAAFQAHPTVANAERMMAASTQAPWKYLGGDMWQLYGDFRADGIHGKYVAKDILYVRDDCQGSN